MIRFVPLGLIGLVAMTACAGEEQPGDVCAAPVTLDAVFQIALGPQPMLPGLREGRDEDVLATARAVFGERFGQITLSSIDVETGRVTCEGFFQSDMFERPTALAYDVSPNLSGGPPVVRVLSHQSELNLVVGTLYRELRTSSDPVHIPTTQHPQASEPSAPSASAPSAEPEEIAPLRLHAVPPRIIGEFRDYQARIREGWSNEPTFAGRYIIITWGCGTGGCTIRVVGDLVSGDLHWLGIGGENFPYMVLEYDNATAYMTAHWYEADADACASQFYRWNGERLIEVGPQRAGPSDECVH